VQQPFLAAGYDEIPAHNVLPILPRLWAFGENCSPVSSARQDDSTVEAARSASKRATAPQRGPQTERAAACRLCMRL